MSAPAWSPDQKLRADATSVEIRARFDYLDDHIRRDTVTAPQPSLFDAPRPHHAPNVRKVPSRILHVAEPLPARSGDDVQWVRALLDEFQNANDSSRRAKCYQRKPTTSGREAGAQTELYQKHEVRKERVVMALVEALQKSARSGTFSAPTP